MSKVFLKVPFAEKDEVKSKGGKFDAENKLWYCFSENLEIFSSQWPVFITCPFADKDDAKKKGALYDGDKKMWFINPGVDLSLFAKWLPNNSIREKPQESSSIKESHLKEDRDKRPLHESSKKREEDKVANKKQKKEKKEDSPVPQVINVQVNNIAISNCKPSVESVDSVAELTKIKGNIKDGCSFDVPTLKGLLKDKGVKGISKLSKQQLIDQCIDLKLLKPVLQLQSQPQSALPTKDSYEKKRKVEKDVVYF